MPITTSEALFEFIKKNKFTCEIQKDLVANTFQIGRKSFTLYLKAMDQGDVLQLLVFLPSHLQPNKHFSATTEETASLTNSISNLNPSAADLSRLLLLLNKELDLPGFGLDELGGTVYFRLMLPTPKKRIDDELLMTYLKKIQHLCAIFSTPIEAISAGLMSLEQFLEKTKEMAKNNALAAT